MAVTGNRVEVEGLNLINRQLTLLAKDEKGINQANYEAATTLLQTARPMVPVRSGKLAASLKAGKAKRYAEVRAGSARVPYAAPIHFGWFYDKKNNIRKNIKPNPFFYRALGLVYDDIITKYESDMQNLIKKHQLD
jgi:hypothetical protein